MVDTDEIMDSIFYRVFVISRLVGGVTAEAGNAKKSLRIKFLFALIKVNTIFVLTNLLNKIVNNG